MLIQKFNTQINIIFAKKISRQLSNVSWIKPESGYDTGIKIYKCTTKQKEPLILKNEKFATWYTCGPTVYDSTHIGHASCYVKLDIIQKILKNYFNIELITAMNITDIDDKIIKKSIESKVENFQQISKLYENEFWKDLRNLNVQEPDIKIRVTENISVIIKFIERLLKNEQAYIGNDNSVYFNVSKYKNYGKLQKLNLDEKMDDSDVNKVVNIDFVLWKVQKEINEPAWGVPWSTTNGRPGWHIECSAMATKIFGNNIDFHAGGLDLKFPHHENEEAQSCCFHNTEKWVNYWLHTGQLNLKGHDQKMSKSLKNTISVSELLQKYSNDEFRMACALSNYRNSMEFSDELMILAKTTLSRFNSFISDCQSYLDGKKDIGSTESGVILKKFNEVKESIDIAIRDDFNTSKCIGYLSDLTNSVSKVINSNEEIYTSSVLTEIATIKNYVQKILNAMGFIERNTTSSAQNVNSDMDFHGLIDEIVEIRQNIRKLAIQNKNENLFKICDEIRDSLKSKNIEIKDHVKGSSWNSN